MMTRTQILLDSALLKRVRRRAAEDGVSLAEYIRRLVERDLESPRVVREPSAVFNLGSSGGADISAHKDRLIGEAMARQQEGERRER